MRKRAKRKPKLVWRPGELSEEQILRWVDEFHANTGQWPTKKAVGRQVIHGSGGDRWSTIDSALRGGNRGLPGGSSLPKLLAKHRGVRNKKGLPRLSYAQILSWADAYYARTGDWPRQDMPDLAIPESPGDKWCHIDDAMRRGLRGLPGDYSLARLLDDKRGVRNRSDLPHLSEAQILIWADAYHTRTGRWPGQRVWREEIPDSGGETWLNVVQSMALGIRGLPGGKSLADLLAETGRSRNMAKLPKLTKKKILDWADEHHERYGRWPTCRGQPQEIEGTFGERWFNIDQVLRKGMRGLTGGTSLYRLLEKHRRVQDH